MNKVDSSSTQLLRGRIQNLHKTRCKQDFFFTAEDRTKMGATAVAAGLAGLGGVATGLSAMAMDTSEEADLLEFNLDGKPVRAWVWVSIFKEGDEVEVVAEQWGDKWQGYGVRRITDRIVALHPHCSRGRYAHYKTVAKWWLKIGIPLLLFMDIISAVMAFNKSVDNWSGIFQMWILGGAGLLFILGLVAFGIARKTMGFVRLAEAIFQGFGWKNVKDIDLPALTMKDKQSNDPGPLGMLYFRH